MNITEEALLDHGFEKDERFGFKHPKLESKDLYFRIEEDALIAFYFEWYREIDNHLFKIHTISALETFMGSVDFNLNIQNE